MSSPFIPKIRVYTRDLRYASAFYAEAISENIYEPHTPAVDYKIKELLMRTQIAKQRMETNPVWLIPIRYEQISPEVYVVKFNPDSYLILDFDQ